MYNTWTEILYHEEIIRRQQFLFLQSLSPDNLPHPSEVGFFLVIHNHISRYT